MNPPPARMNPPPTCAVLAVRSCVSRVSFSGSKVSCRSLRALHKCDTSVTAGATALHKRHSGRDDAIQASRRARRRYTSVTAGAT
eukprot:8118349-Pyramimonas_sp.AAC.1